MNWYIKVLKQYADFDGRARRKEYWMFILFHMIISYGLQILGGIAESMLILGLAGVYSLAVIIPSIAVGVRRMHDQGKSGWFILIPIYNLILFCTDGDRSENEYGPDPKGDNINEIGQA